MGNTTWTFDTLAQADRATLERVLLNARPPDPARLTGSVYDGFNHDWLGQLAGKKFRKAFFLRAEQRYGLNQMVQQDGGDLSSEWRLRLENGQPVELGYFRILPASDSASSGQARYRHLVCFDYNVALNPKGNWTMRAIRDYVGMPNEGDYDLLLGKAYLQFAPFLRIFASYFILGHRKPYTAP